MSDQEKSSSYSFWLMTEDCDFFCQEATILHMMAISTSNITNAEADFLKWRLVPKSYSPPVAKTNISAFPALKTGIKDRKIRWILKNSIFWRALGSLAIVIYIIPSRTIESRAGWSTMCPRFRKGCSWKLRSFCSTATVVYVQCLTSTFKVRNRGSRRKRSNSQFEGGSGSPANISHFWWRLKGINFPDKFCFDIWIQDQFHLRMNGRVVFWNYFLLVNSNAALQNGVEILIATQG